MNSKPVRFPLESEWDVHVQGQGGQYHPDSCGCRCRGHFTDCVFYGIPQEWIAMIEAGHDMEDFFKTSMKQTEKKYIMLLRRLRRLIVQYGESYPALKPFQDQIAKYANNPPHVIFHLADEIIKVKSHKKITIPLIELKETMNLTKKMSYVIECVQQLKL